MSLTTAITSALLKTRLEPTNSRWHYTVTVSLISTSSMPRLHVESAWPKLNDSWRSEMTSLWAIYSTTPDIFRFPYVCRFSWPVLHLHFLFLFHVHYSLPLNLTVSSFSFLCFFIVNGKELKPLTCQNKNIVKCKAKVDSLWQNLKDINCMFPIFSPFESFWPSHCWLNPL